MVKNFEEIEVLKVGTWNRNPSDRCLETLVYVLYICSVMWQFVFRLSIVIVFGISPLMC